MKNKNVAFMTQAAMIAAIYVVLTYIFAPISFGEIQVRIAEALTILPLFTPAAIPGLFIGCLLGNVVGGALLPDIIFGSRRTLFQMMGKLVWGNVRQEAGACLVPARCNSGPESRKNRFLFYSTRIF